MTVPSENRLPFIQRRAAAMREAPDLAAGEFQVHALADINWLLERNRHLEAEIRVLRAELDEAGTPDVTGVRVLRGYVVEVTFADGTVGAYDFTGKLRGPVFEPLHADYELFRSVRVEPEMGTIVWPVGDDPDAWPDWAPEELYEHIRAQYEDAGHRQVADEPEDHPTARQASGRRRTPPMDREPAAAGSVEETLPTLTADLTWARVNGGRASAVLANWDLDRPPRPGERVRVGHGGPFHTAIVTAVTDDGTIKLLLPEFAGVPATGPHPTALLLRADLNAEDDDGHGWAVVPPEEFQPGQVYPGARVIAGHQPGAHALVTVLRTELFETTGGAVKVLVTFDKDGSAQG